MPSTRDNLSPFRTSYWFDSLINTAAAAYILRSENNEADQQGHASFQIDREEDKTAGVHRLLLCSTLFNHQHDHQHSVHGDEEKTHQRAVISYHLVSCEEDQFGWLNVAWTENCRKCLFIAAAVSPKKANSARNSSRNLKPQICHWIANISSKGGRSRLERGCQRQTRFPKMSCPANHRHLISSYDRQLIISSFTEIPIICGIYYAFSSNATEETPCRHGPLKLQFRFIGKHIKHHKYSS